MPYVSNAQRKAVWASRNEKKKSGFKMKSPLKACWKSHVQKGMKKKGNRMVPNCVPRKNK